MALRRWAVLALLAVSTSACFHQVVNTGRTPGATVIDKPFVNTFVFGIVPAKDIDVTRECPNGVATVETEQSFVNGLVAVITLGIYTPQHARITCAAARTSLRPDLPELRIPADASAEQRLELSAKALELSSERGMPVVVRF